MELKDYQKRALDTIGEFLALTREFSGRHDRAFRELQETKSEPGILLPPYNNSFNVPFVCIKIPTGGGKTFVACHAVQKIMQEYLLEKNDKGIIVWFTPSDEIKSQTLRKLNDKKDPHRRALDEAFSNNIKIFSNEEALRINESDPQNDLCIIVASLDAFRKEESKRDKYKVYKENGALMSFFSHIDDDSKLEKDESGPINSLANVIRLYNPLIIVDEGHRTKSIISELSLKDLNPSFILEFTATPRSGSNILVDTKSQELKQSQMVKIPLVLESKKDWKEVIGDGINQRKELEKIAKKDKDYIRPIALLQAEPNTKERSVTVEVIKKYLIEDLSISEEEIAIKISNKNELEGQDLFSRDCKVRYIITINALAEGWDCSFAYVLVSVANLGSKIAVEQILGRIIRMPYAKKRKLDELNKSYVFASAKNFQEAAELIISGLQKNGYTSRDIQRAGDKEENLYIGRNINFEEFGVPTFAADDRKLQFGEDLIGAEFVLAKQDYEVDFMIPMSEDGKGEIDINSEGEWFKGRVKQLKLHFHNDTETADSLARWIDHHIRIREVSQNDKVEYINKVISFLIEQKKVAFRDLSLFRYLLKEKIEKKIKDIMGIVAKDNFDLMLSRSQLSLKIFDNFPK